MALGQGSLSVWSTEDLPRAQSWMEKGGEWVWKGKRMSSTDPHGRWRWGWDSLRKVPTAWPSENVQLLCPNTGPACRETVHALPWSERGEKYNHWDAGLGSQATLALPWLWGGSLMSWEKLLTSLNLSWIWILLYYYKVFLPLILRVSLLSAERNKYILSRKLNIAMKGVPSQEFRDLDYMV